MKTKKSTSLALLSTLTALVLLSPAALAASSTPLNLTVEGIIVNAGSQTYSFSGGAVAQGEVLGSPIAGPINYHFSASVNGLTTAGSGQVTIPASRIAGGHGAVVVSIQIADEQAAAVFPLSPDGSSCTEGCNSEIPMMFLGMATISEAGQSYPVPVAVESPYWNPFGGPIVITSMESATSPALFLIVGYTRASIDWRGVQVAGLMNGGLGGMSVSGSYLTVTNSHEDLFHGFERDSGQIYFADMTQTMLNGQGALKGNTTIPQVVLSGPGTNSYDCTSAYAAALGFSWPFGPGTCTLTGALSSGTFKMTGSSGAKISGTYGTAWSIPSVTTATTVTALVTQH